MTVPRPRFREGQRLTAADLAAEQDYLVDGRRAHDSSLHGWGIARGLGLSAVTAGIVVAPGFAVDGFGRSLVVHDPLRVRWADVPADAAALEVWLWYVEEGVADRTVEGVCVQVRPVVAPASRSIGSPQTTDERSWPVFLGRLSRTGGEPPYQMEDTELTYLTVLGANVVSPTGTEIILGVEPVFTLDVPGPVGTQVGRLTASETTGVAIAGTVFTPSAALLDEEPLFFGDPIPEPQQSFPWRWYREQTTVDGVATGQSLRVELGALPESAVPGWYRFAVRTVSGPDTGGGTPEALLAIDAGGTTTVSGDLTAIGPVVQGPLGTDPQDTRLAASLLGTWVDAVDATSRAVDQRFSGDLVNTGVLAVTIRMVSGPDSAAETRTLQYELRVRNAGEQTVTDLSVVTATTIAGNRELEVVAKGQRLAPAGTYTAARAVTLPDDATDVLVSVTAIGLLPGGQVCFGGQELHWHDSSGPVIG
jgi:hypothetical protein